MISRICIGIRIIPKNRSCFPSHHNYEYLNKPLWKSWDIPPAVQRSGKIHVVSDPGPGIKLWSLPKSNYVVSPIFQLLGNFISLNPSSSLIIPPPPPPPPPPVHHHHHHHRHHHHHHHSRRRRHRRRRHYHIYLFKRARKVGKDTILNHLSSRAGCLQTLRQNRTQKFRGSKFWFFSASLSIATVQSRHCMHKK